MFRKVLAALIAALLVFPALSVAPAFEHGVPFFTAALAGATLRVAETSSAATDAAMTLRNMKYLRR